MIRTARAAHIKVVTLDSDTTRHDSLGYIGTDNEAAGAAQQPEKRGALAVLSLVKALKGASLPPTNTTGVDVVTRANLAAFER